MLQLLVPLLLGVVIHQTPGGWSLAGAPGPLTSFYTLANQPTLAVTDPLEASGGLEPVTEQGDEREEIWNGSTHTGQWRETSSVPHGAHTLLPTITWHEATTIPGMQLPDTTVHLSPARQSSSRTHQTHTSVNSEGQEGTHSSPYRVQLTEATPTGHSKVLPHSKVDPRQIEGSSVGAVKQRGEDDWLFAGSGQATPTSPSSIIFVDGATSVLSSAREWPCEQGWGPCVAPAAPDGVMLRWDDMHRTLSFSWELHVFGTGGLSLTLAAAALIGLICPHQAALSPGCLALANMLLLLSGVLRAAHFLLDPYGTRGLLPHRAITVLHNLHLPLLLWAQVALVLLAWQGASRTGQGSGLQRPLLTGACAGLHCSLLLAADLLSGALPHMVPVLLQALSLSWGLGLSLGLLTCGHPHLHPAGHVPRRVLAAGALQGALCCTLQVHTMLWLYGLLGNWRQFSWGWWVTQFWARLLELTWTWTLLLLISRGPWVGTNPDRGQCCLAVLVAHLPGQSERTVDDIWAELLPNNWAAFVLSRQERHAERGVGATGFGGHGLLGTAANMEDSKSHSELEAGAVSIMEPQEPLVELSQSLLLQRLLVENSRFWPSFSRPTSPSPVLSTSNLAGTCKERDVSQELQGINTVENPVCFTNEEITQL